MTKEVNPNVPIQSEEIADEVYRFQNEGAPIVHFHARDKEGNATTDPQVFREIDRRIKRKGGETSLIQRSISTGRGAGYAAKSDLKGITEKSVFSVVDLTHYRREVI